MAITLKPLGLDWARNVKIWTVHNSQTIRTCILGCICLGWHPDCSTWLGIFSRRQIDDNFLIFPRKQDMRFHANYLLSCMKSHILFSGKNKKNISKYRLLKILPKVLSNNEAAIQCGSRTLSKRWFITCNRK